MKRSILILGGTGATGRQVIHQLLGKGEDVVSLVRSKERLIASLPDVQHHDNLSIIESTVLTMTDKELENCMKGCQVIVCCLGHNLTMSGMFGKPRRLVTDSIQRVCDTLKQSRPSQPTKLILMGSNGVANPDGSDDHRSLSDRILLGLLRLLIPPVRDNEAAAEYLSKTIGRKDETVQWVVVRPDDLIDEDLSEYNPCSKPSGSLFGAGEVSRSNVATFMCELIQNDVVWKNWLHRMPVLQNVKTVEKK